MSNCSNKIKHTCGDKYYATCVYYETELPDWSSLVDEDCVVLAETTEELYEEVTTLKTETDVSDVESDCLTITQDGEGKVTVKTLLESLVAEVETLKCPEEVTNDLDLTDLELDLKCLEDECGDPLELKLKPVLQALIDKACDEDETTQTLINAGAVDLSKRIIDIQTTTASALTLAAGREGQHLFLVMTVDGGNATLAIPTLSTGTQAVFDAVEDHLELYFAAGKWRIISNNSVTIS